VKDFLNEFQDSDIVAVNWLNFDDMGKIDRDRRIPVNKFFTHPANKWNEFFHYKQFLRPGFRNIEIHQHNVVFLENGISDNGIGFNFRNPSEKERIPVRRNVKHKELPLDEYLTYHFENDAFIKHVLTKTITEYIEEKAFNGKPTGVDDRSNGQSFGYFFDVNERTKEKEQVIQKFLDERNKKLKPVFLLHPTLPKIKKYSEGKFDIVITSDESYRTYFNRPSRILIMSLKDASEKFKNKLKILN